VVGIGEVVQVQDIKGELLERGCHEGLVKELHLEVLVAHRAEDQPVYPIEEGLGQQQNLEEYHHLAEEQDMLDLQLPLDARLEECFVVDQELVDQDPECIEGLLESTRLELEKELHHEGEQPHLVPHEQELHSEEKHKEYHLVVEAVLGNQLAAAYTSA